MHKIVTISAAVGLCAFAITASALPGVVGPGPARYSTAEGVDFTKMLPPKLRLLDDYNGTNTTWQNPKLHRDYAGFPILPLSRYCGGCVIFNEHNEDPQGHIVSCYCRFIDPDDPKHENKLFEGWFYSHANLHLWNKDGKLTWNRCREDNNTVWITTNGSLQPQGTATVSTTYVRPPEQTTTTSSSSTSSSSPPPPTTPATLQPTVTTVTATTVVTSTSVEPRFSTRTTLVTQTTVVTSVQEPSPPFEPVTYTTIFTETQTTTAVLPKTVSTNVTLTMTMTAPVPTSPLPTGKTTVTEVAYATHTLSEEEYSSMVNGGTAMAAPTNVGAVFKEQHAAAQDRGSRKCMGTMQEGHRASCQDYSVEDNRWFHAHCFDVRDVLQHTVIDMDEGFGWDLSIAEGLIAQHTDVSAPH